jgi:hypothetical protein
MITKEQLEAAYARDQLRLGQKVYDPAELPVDWDGLTTEWLTGTLCAGHPGAAVTAFSLAPFETATTNRTYLAVDYNDTGRAAGLPRKLFCKATHLLPSRFAVGMSGAVEAEIAFYLHIRPHLDIEAPHGHYGNLDPESLNSILMLGDLTGEVSEYCTHKTTMTRDRAEDQVSLLAAFHGAGYSNPRVQAELGRLQTWIQFFNGTLVFGMREGSEEGFRRAEDLIPPRLHRRADEIWPKTVAAVELNKRLPQTLVHSDVHLKNWYITSSGAMALTDWQCASTGHWGRDFGYAIGTALAVEDRRAWERDLLALYLDRLHAAGGPKVTFEDGWTAYRQQLMSALTWWTITYNPAPDLPADMQPVDTSREFVKRLATAMDDVETLDSFD